ncbi:VOC family protein [Actinomadura rudentiformis]|uniref:VOC family protein n=1 Tax=Actinomadura rudentiformis TaxID=359158 RepID=A0A6H9YJ85_9ACTN|nr:VOC family protein [Actinomadura rudentiformis]KAB2345492.1 VOC family protein [Actinomadura rudentiformis]
MATELQIAIDCADPAKLAEFWALALGYELEPPPPGFASWDEALRARGIPESEWNSASALRDPDGRGPRLFFQRVPEPKEVKNRLHLDLRVGGPLESPVAERARRINTAVERLADAGASVVEPRDGQWGEHWVVMQDPEGNEFCVS